MKPVSIKVHAPHLLPPKTFGLGDAVAAVAQPVAKALDRALGTSIANCGGCKKRQQDLNKLVPSLTGHKQNSLVNHQG